MAFETLLVEEEGGLAIVTLNRPRQLNALNRAMVRELDELAARFEAGFHDARSPRVVIFTGAGDRAFMAGADITEFQGLTPMESLTFDQRIQRLFSRLEALPQITIAAINGFALGGGCELTQCCDLVVAAESARFGQPEVNLGVIPGAGGTQRLARIVGMHRAKELNLLGEMIDAQEAHRIGIVNRVVPAARLMAEARALADKLLAKAPLDAPPHQGRDERGLRSRPAQGPGPRGEELGGRLLDGGQVEGVSAFLEKRKPAFKGK